MAKHETNRKTLRQRGLPLLLKRAFDVAVSGTALCVTAPVMAAAALSVRASMGSPVIFRQKRPGLFGEPFEVYKLRTMLDSHDASGRLLPDHERLTKLGKFLRETSLDELPQLLNVLKGDMSLVGPRPLLMQYLERYDARQATRHNVLPGITGWAQVHGRNALSWDEKFALDVHYVENWSLWLDVQIIAKTVSSVWKRDGISAGGHATMPEFLGNLDAFRVNARGGEA